MNETTHDEENVSEAEDDTSQEENVIEMQIYEHNWEHSKQEEELLTTNFEVKVTNRKVDGLITYSTDQQLFKLKVNSVTDQEVWGVYIDFQSIHSKWMIDAILQHMGFYVNSRKSKCDDEGESQYTIFRIQNHMSRWIIYCICYTRRNFIYVERQI